LKRHRKPEDLEKMDSAQLSKLRHKVYHAFQLYNTLLAKSRTETEQYIASAWRGIFGYIYQIEKETGFEFETLCRKFGYILEESVSAF